MGYYGQAYSNIANVTDSAISKVGGKVMGLTGIMNNNPTSKENIVKDIVSLNQPTDVQWQDKYNTAMTSMQSRASAIAYQRQQFNERKEKILNRIGITEEGGKK